MIADANADRTISALAGVKKKLVMGLSDCESPESPTAIGIARTNAIPMRDPSKPADPLQRAGLFALTCRCNHDCKPVARYIWREDLQRQLVVAIQPIHAGEEITVSYGGIIQPRAVRQRDLQERFGFSCDCRACAGPLDWESDERVTMIQTLIADYNPITKTDPRKALEMVETALWLLRAEGLDTPSNTWALHHDAFQLALHMNDHPKAKRHIMKAIWAVGCADGPDNPLVARYRKLDAYRAHCAEQDGIELPSDSDDEAGGLAIQQHKAHRGQGTASPPERETPEVVAQGSASRSSCADRLDGDLMALD